MGAVIFLFIWLNKPSEEELAARRQAIEMAEGKNPDEVDNVQPLVALTSAETAKIVPTVRTFGKPVAGSPDTYRLSSGAVDLTVSGSDSAAVLTGTVKVGDRQVDVNDIIAADFPDLTPEQAQQATSQLKSAISDVNKYKSFAPYISGENTRLSLENDIMKVTFSTKGGIIDQVTLKDYKTETTTPPTDINLFTPETAAYGFTLVTAEQRIRTADLYFKPVQVNDTTLAMSLDLGKGVTWQIRYTLVPDVYLVKMDIVQHGMDAVIPPSTTTLNMDWDLHMARNEKGRTFEERNSAIYYKFTGEKPDYLNEGKDETEKLTGSIRWIGFKNQFFSSVLIPRTNFTTADIEQKIDKDGSFLKQMQMDAVMPYSSADGSPASFTFYFGPNSYPLLSSLDDKISPDGEDLELNRLVPLGWGIFRWINQLIVIPVFNFLSKFISNYGIIILLLTIFIKLILFPFTYKSYMSQAKMRVLAPEIKEINEKYPGQENAMKRQQETMALYSKAGASPFSGCLPMLLQMPVLVAMFAFFPSAIELRGQSFLWAHDLSAPDSILTLPFSIPFYGNHVSLFCLLMTIVNIIYTRMNMQNQPGNASMPGMKWMMYLMPVMFLFFFNDYASGLSYYYLLSLLITIFQYWVFRRIVDEKKVRAQMMENAKKPRKKSGFMARLEAAQKQQEAYMREQAKKNAKRRR